MFIAKKDPKETFWHNLSVEDVFKKLNTSLLGLNDDEVEKRKLEFGLNLLPSVKTPNIFVIFLHQFLNPLIYILILAGLLTLFLEEFSDAIFIFIVIFFNAVIGAWQENRAEKNASALRKLIKISAVVIRNGTEFDLDSVELVPGDIIKFDSGDRVPADIRIIEQKNLSVDESLLTGESSAVEKQVNKISELSTEIRLQSNILFAGTSIITGRATGVIIRTGLSTEIGKIAEVISSTKSEKPPLVIRMEQFTKKISLIILIACLVLMIIALAKGWALLEIFFLAVALAVSAIPEGLPIALTVALSVAAFRMSKKNVIVRKLTAVEGLGSCTMIASDKTGTLTVNEQTAKMIYLPSNNFYEVDGQGYNGEGKITNLDPKNKEKNKDLDELIFAGLINNEGDLSKNNNKWYYHGDSIDIAFLALALKNNQNLEKIKKNTKILSIIPYESEKRYSAIVIENKNKEKEIFIKGAVDIILSKCDFSLVNNKNKKINKQEVLKQLKKMAESGYRVLALAKKITDLDSSSLTDLEEKDLKKFVFLGLVGFIDPLRDDSKISVEKCRGAGIEVIMITGDHPITAFTIAKDLGILKSDTEVITGKEIEQLGAPDNQEFYNKISSYKVFAQVSPLQKYQIVEAMIKSGHFVAVTGDGVNDAPALKKANLGIAMGSGTDVAKETASMIVVDNNFSSIVSGIEEGRFAYDNVRKVIFLLISTAFAEIILFSLAIFSSLPLPLFAVQLLWLNLVTNGIQDVALAVEPGEEDAMSRKPRSPKEAIFNSLMLKQTFLAGLVMGSMTFIIWVVFLNYFKMQENFARNLIFLLMVLFENLHVLNCRSENKSIFKISLFKNKILIGSIITAQLLHIFALNNPFLSKILGTNPVTLKQWLTLLIIAFSIIVSSELFKLFKKINTKKYNF